MSIIIYLISSSSLLIALLIGIVMYKLFIKKRSVVTAYTPFDYIAGQSDVEFHEKN